MNYKIILDEKELNKFIKWLPELEEGECYYVSLFARKKYHPSAKNDKSQCKRFTATSKEWLLKKIKQLEIVDGAYTNKDGTPVHGDSLALYISVNPRSFKLAQRALLKKLADTLVDPLGQHTNPSSMALSAIQKARSRSTYVDFDIDGADFDNYRHIIGGIINEDAYRVLETRGGFHLLVNPNMVWPEMKNTWYKDLIELDNCDVAGDNLIPVAGCTQGGFCPKLL